LSNRRVQPLIDENGNAAPDMAITEISVRAT